MARRARTKAATEASPASGSEQHGGAEPQSRLAAYRARRDFARTAEPPPEPQARMVSAEDSGHAAGMFVVQHHWARRDHFDFRLELDGVLVSFAVTRGPSLDPSERRLAVRTEDHPLAYASFEGTIPKGEYGGGTVMLWDHGTWRPLDADPAAALARGELKFELYGERMLGRWVLVRMNVERGRENWLLIKEKDDFASRTEDLVAAHDRSVATGRSRAEIEAGGAVWHSNRGKDGKAAAVEAPREKRSGGAEAGAPPTGTATSARLPAAVPPMLCDTRAEAPTGDDWIHEIKYDGYRLEAAVDGAAVRLTTREGLDWTARFPSIARALGRLGLDRTLLDGEAVVFDGSGLSDFPALVAALDRDGGAIAYVTFDLIVDRGQSIADRPLVERKRLLESRLARADGVAVRVAAHVVGNGPEVFAQAIDGGAEGIVSKRATSPYRSGRGTAWAKVKGDRREDVVVVGYTPSDRRPFKSLLVAIEENGGLRYVGRIGSGFGTDELSRTRARLDALHRDRPPPMAASELVPKGVVFVEPRLRAEVAAAGFTGDRQIRQGRFLGWREDRAPFDLGEAAADKGRRAMAKTGGKGEPGGPETPPSAPKTTKVDPGIAPAKAGGSQKARGARAATMKTGAAPDAAALLQRISHGDRVVFPEVGVTKRQVADYYLAVADRILPHLDGRPVSFVRAPEGIAAETFFQRHPLPGMKRGLTRIPDRWGRHGDYLALDGLEGLITAAQFGVVELHGWGARLPELDRPDRMVFDFDPDEGLAFDAVRRAAHEVRAALAAVGLESFAMASGGKGLHVVVPLDGSQDWDVIGDFSAGLARGLARADPARYVAVASKAKREGRIYVDWLRNRRSATAIVPWSLRARPTASVAVPIAWDEVDTIAAPNAFDIHSAPGRKDPGAGFFETRQRIDPAALAYLKKASGK